MKTILETIQAGAGYLEERGIDDARHNMEWLVAKVIGCDRMGLYVQFERPLEEPELVQLRELTKRRAGGEPLQHLLGNVDFMGREFVSDSRALIPRPETEELVDRTLVRLADGEGEGAVFRAADIGCGSGVIGLTLAAERPGWDLTLTDAHDGPLSLARENAEALGLSDRVTFSQGDLAAPLDGAFHLIASNLPYIPSAEIPGLAAEVQCDPHAALDGGEDGTDLIRRLLGEALPKLVPGGLVALEVGRGQTEALAAHALSLGYAFAEAEDDLSENDRFLFCETARPGA